MRPRWVMEKLVDACFERTLLNPDKTSAAVADAGSERHRCLGSGSKDSTRTEIMVGNARSNYVECSLSLKRCCWMMVVMKQLRLLEFSAQKSGKFLPRAANWLRIIGCRVLQVSSIVLFDVEQTTSRSSLSTSMLPSSSDQTIQSCLGLLDPSMFVTQAGTSTQ